MLLGVFVGGASRRMGGAPKGLLPVDGEPLLARTLRIAREAGLACVLVGRVDAYRALARDVEALADEPAGIGPLGGLSALLARAEASSLEHALAVACDMPHLSARALRALADDPSDASIVAARRAPEAPWEPMFARYRIARARPALAAALAAGERSFQRLFARVDVAPFALAADDADVLLDWDTPDDVRRARAP